jgi:hypothetical protein
MKRFIFALSLVSGVGLFQIKGNEVQEEYKEEVKQSEFDSFLDMFGENSWLKKECNANKDNVQCKQWAKIVYGLKTLPNQARVSQAEKKVHANKADDRDFEIVALDQSIPLLGDIGLYKISSFVDSMARNAKEPYSLQEIIAEKAHLLKKIQELTEQRNKRTN